MTSVGKSPLHSPLVYYLFFQSVLVSPFPFPVVDRKSKRSLFLFCLPPFLLVLEDV